MSPAQADKLQAEFAKVSKLLDNGKGEVSAHVRLSQERHLTNVEVTIPYHHHELVGHGSDADMFSALHAAVAKLEKQAIKVKDKWREGFRGSGKTESGEAGELGESKESSR